MNHHFCPSKRHRWLPYILLILMLLGTFMGWVTPVRSQDEASWLFAQINNLRASKGLPAYSRNGILDATAQQHSLYLANNPWTDPHREADGSTPRSRMVAAGYRGTFMGENVYGGSLATAQIAFNWWLNSPIHYSGLINTNYTEVGIGVGAGTYGRFYTLDFGGGSGAAPAQPQPVANNPNPVGQPPAQAAPPTRIPPTRRPTQTFTPIPSNTPAPTLTPSTTFTRIPSRTPSPAPSNVPTTATPIPFEASAPLAAAVTVAPTTEQVKVALAATLTPSESPRPTLPPLTGIVAPEVANTAPDSDMLKVLIPAGIGLQIALLGGMILRRSRRGG